MKPARLLSSVLVLVTGLVLPAAGEVPVPDYAALNVMLIKEHAVPRYALFEAESRHFADVAERACENGENSTAALQTGYHRLMDSWQIVQHIRFGPILETHRLERIQFWPDKKNLTSKHLKRVLKAADDELLEPERFADTSVALQGLPALERLLFGGQTSALEGYACELTEAIANNLQTIAGELHQAWADEGSDFRKSLEQPKEDALLFRSHKEVTQAFHGALSGGLQFVVDLKLMRPLGSAPEKARHRRMESWRAARSLRNLSINLAAFKSLYAGPDDAKISMRSILLQLDEDEVLDTQVSFGFSAARDILNSLPDSAAGMEADTAIYRKLQLLLTQFSIARNVVDAELSGALGLTLGFNALDGD